MTLNKSLSIIIPHLKGQKILDACVQSILKCSISIDYEIIIVNNNCVDGSIAYIQKKVPNIKIIHSKNNKGYAGGCNLGAKNAVGYFLLFLNNDTILTENCIENLINIMKKYPKISAAQPKIKNYFNQNMFDYAGACGGYIDYLGYPFARGRILNTIEKDEKQYDDEQKIFWASGTCFITKTKIFHEMNGFDEFLFAHMEEVDYHWRCLLNGYEIYIQPKATIYHKGAQTLAYGSYKKTYLNHRNSMILFLTNNQKLLFINILKRLCLEKLACINYLLRGKVKSSIAIMNANLWLLFNINYLIKRKKRIKKNTTKSYYNISNKLMVPYSIIKKYFFNKQQTFKQLY